MMTLSWAPAHGVITAFADYISGIIPLGRQTGSVWETREFTQTSYSISPSVRGLMHKWLDGWTD